MVEQYGRRATLKDRNISTDQPFWRKLKPWSRESDPAQIFAASLEGLGVQAAIKIDVAQKKGLSNPTLQGLNTEMQVVRTAIGSVILISETRGDEVVKSALVLTGAGVATDYVTDVTDENVSTWHQPEKTAQVAGDLKRLTQVIKKARIVSIHGNDIEKWDKARTVIATIHETRQAS